MKRIPLYGRRGDGKFALVDDEDYELMSSFRWNISSVEEYVTTNIYDGERNKRGWLIQKRRRMHRMIMNAPAHLLVDHVDGDTLNNTRANLRLCTALGNARNAALRRDNTTGAKGVFWHERLHKWQAHIRVNKRLIYLGLYPTKNEAAWAYAQAAKRYFGEFVRSDQIRHPSRPRRRPSTHRP